MPCSSWVVGRRRQRRRGHAHMAPRSAVLGASFVRPSFFSPEAKCFSYWSQKLSVTSLAKTASGLAVESIQLALIEMTKWPPVFKKWCELRATIRVWSGWATSAKTQSTMPTNILYFHGWRASSIIGTRNGLEITNENISLPMLVRFLHMLSKSRPDRWENSTA